MLDPDEMISLEESQVETNREDLVEPIRDGMNDLRPGIAVRDFPRTGKRMLIDVSVLVVLFEAL